MIIDPLLLISIFYRVSLPFISTISFAVLLLAKKQNGKTELSIYSKRERYSWEKCINWNFVCCGYIQNVHTSMAAFIIAFSSSLCCFLIPVAVDADAARPMYLKRKWKKSSQWCKKISTIYIWAKRTNTLQRRMIRDEIYKESEGYGRHTLQRHQSEN